MTEESKIVDEGLEGVIEEKIETTFHDTKCYVTNINSFNYLKWNEYLMICNSREIEKIMSFVFQKDQIRALISIVLQKYVIMRKYGIVSPNIQRTREVCPKFISQTSEFLQNKPYLPYPVSQEEKHWNYNVSHHGDYVGIICNDNLLV